MTLTEHLHLAFPKPCNGRPFVCDGRTESCAIIVIGDNPATQTDTDWWSFWDDATGFDLGRFEKHYQKIRVDAGKRPVSSTRSRLNHLRRRGLRCLETNVFTNEKLGGHGSTGRPNELLDVLIRNIPHLEAVIAHGDVAKKYLSKLDLPDGVRGFPMQHFIRTGFATLDRVVEELTLALPKEP